MSDASELADDWQDREIPWIHSSDLSDPTPFLSDGYTLLTTGMQFGTVGTPSLDEASRYVARLVERGLSALGFGTEVVRSGPPDALIAACAEAALPLFTVPYRTPFIAVVQANANELAREANARETWALAAQRAIALAALRPDGLTATLAELSNRLDGWVALFDASGALQREYRAAAVSRDEVASVATSIGHLLRRGQRASASVQTGARTITLQSLGSGGNLRGVLALGPSDYLDQAGREVVTSVIAMAGLALEQNHELDRARSLLRSGLLQLMIGGEIDLVRRIASELWGELPLEPFRVAAASVPERDAERAAEFLELWTQENPGQLFFGERERSLVLCIPAGSRGPAGRLAESFGASIGVSDPCRYDELPTALEQARQALRRSREGAGGVVEFDDVSRSGMLAHLARGDARSIARSVLAVLGRHDQEHGTQLVPFLRVWIENGCELDATARVLGLHRHTVRARVAQAGTILGRDLSSFSARAELWATFAALGS